MGLGNGSPSGEFLSGSLRLLGIKSGFVKGSYLRHLLSVAGLAVPIKVASHLYAGAVFKYFAAKGRRVKHAKVGDLVFFGTIPRAREGSDGRFTTAAVVESRGAGGTLVCIGWVLGEVRRFRMNTQRAHRRRDESSGTRLNDVIRGRSMSEGTGKGALAGELFMGFIRL